MPSTVPAPMATVRSSPPGPTRVSSPVCAAITRSRPLRSTSSSVLSTSGLPAGTTTSNSPYSRPYSFWKYSMALVASVIVWCLPPGRTKRPAKTK